MHKPPEKGLTLRRSVLVGLAVAIPFSIIAFIFGYFFNLTSPTPVDANTTQSASTTNSAKTNVDKDLKIKGNKSSRIYHLPNCPNYNDISDRNLVWFKTHEEAKAAGFRMARNC